MYRTLLVPLDASPFGEQALPLALSIARRAEADVHVVHVHNPLAGLYPEGAAYIDDALEAHLRDSQRAYLDSVVRRVAAVSPVHVTPAFLEGGITESLRVLAASTPIDLVVMTTHGRGPLGRFWLGSVADALIRELPMPLLLVRPQEAPLDLGKEPVLQHILLPLDGSALAEQMIEPAIALGSLMDADYTLLRVIKPPAPVNLHPEVAAIGEIAQSVVHQIDKLQEQLHKEAEDYLERVAERLRKRSLRVRTRVAVEDQPAIAVLHEVAAQSRPASIDLVALETHGRRGLSRMFLGSVADKVVRGASVPVLVHHPVYQ
jgi:nucleotide-binding universal stress UspA family protein